MKKMNELLKKVFGRDQVNLGFFKIGYHGRRWSW